MATGHVKIEYDWEDHGNPKVTIDGQEVRGLVSVEVTRLAMDEIPTVRFVLEPGTLEYDGVTEVVSEELKEEDEPE